MQTISPGSGDGRSPVVTRFAPSPTGQVHIGNIRVAIYNWLFARHHGGRFLLRIEDTDRARSTDEAVRALLEAMEWLGLDYDGEPVFQSRRREAHLEAADRLLAAGAAYRTRKGEGAGEVIVFRMPPENMEFEDLVRGRLKKAADDLQDFVIVRSDGTPVFHLANVVDDIDMGVTHVIRGDDHIENTFRHLALYRALGAEPPFFAHLPMIVNDQGKPYSKRDGAAYVGEFRRQGYLPEAVFNYLVLLGWSPGDDREILSRDELIRLFDLDRVRPSASRMDLQKLMWMNGEYIRALPEEDYQRRFRQALEEAGLLSGAEDEQYVQRVGELLRARLRYFGQVKEMAVYFFREDYAWDMRAVEKRFRVENARDRLRECGELMAQVDPFVAADIEREVRAAAERRGLKAAVYIHLLRVAVSGTDRGPGLFEMLELLGRDRVLARIQRALRELPFSDLQKGTAGQQP
ncbi:MAG: glutamate--tRNA ligase [Verrucomicrobia bacterium]|nr:MAG: glutamate--tRNA ligase [Verrucomicrobiota bacterium]